MLHYPRDRYRRGSPATLEPQARPVKFGKFGLSIGGGRRSGMNAAIGQNYPR